MRRWQILLFILVFSLFAFTRFYNIDKRIIFDWDQQNFSYQIKDIIEKGKLTLIGPRANNDLGFFLGPYFTYFLLPFYALTRLDPSALTFFIIVIDLLFFTTAFLVLRKISGFMGAVFFLSLWSINYLLALYDIIPWWPVLIPLGTILVLNFLFEIDNHNLKRDWLMLGLILGLFVNMHFQFVFLILFSVVFLIFLCLKQRKIEWQKILLLGFGFILMFIPLLIFDLRHNFLNFHLFLNFFSGSKKQLGVDYLSWTIVLGNFLKPLSATSGPVWAIISITVLAFLSVFSGRTAKNTYTKIFSFSFVVILALIPIFFICYGTRPSEYYFTFLYPLIYVLLVNFILNFKRRSIILVAVFLFILIFNLQPLIANLKDNDFGFFYKKMLIEKINEKSRGKNFNISFQVPLGWTNGYDYLFDIYKIKQSKNYSDPSIIIRIPPKKTDIVVNKIGLVIPESLIDQKN